MCLTSISLILKRMTNMPSRQEGPCFLSPSVPCGRHSGCFTLSLCNAVKDVLAR